jgi:hypothetical protein
MYRPNQTCQMYKNYIKKKGVLYSRVHKFLLVMRLSALIILTTLIQVSASTFAQRITIVKNQVQLEEVVMISFSTVTR